MRRHVKASFVATVQASDRQQAVIGRASLVVLGLVAFLGIGVPSASAVDTCPNAIFRTGPSAKLPECRAYELVSPAYTGGVQPTYGGLANDLPGMFATDTVTPAGSSVVYHAVGGALSGYSGTGYVDRYLAKRTPDGWVTEPISPGGDEMENGGPGGVSADHEYSVGGAVNPSAKLWPAFAGEPLMNVLRTPQGYEPLARGSLGDAPRAWADWISAAPTHVIFNTNHEGDEKDPPLEPGAPSGHVETIYDRTPGGPTHVVSLLPGNLTPSGDSRFLGTTKDGTEVAFEVDQGSGVSGANPIYVRRNNAVTEEVARPSGLVVGKKLTCTGGPGGATLAYQWLRDGNAIGAATSSTYTTTAADEGSVLQCRVTASNGEGTSLAVSPTRVVEPYQGMDFPETSVPASINEGIGVATVGTLLTCSGGGASGFTPEYQWLSDGNEIGAATSSTYTPVEADVGHALQCRVRTSNANGAALAYSFAVSIYKSAPTATANPTVSNLTNVGDLTPAVGDELSCSQGTWSASPNFAYSWLRNGTAIGGATSSSYTTTVADEEKAIQCLVTASSSGGSTTAASERVVVDPQPASAPPKQTFPSGVFGVAKVGSTLFCGAGGWEGAPSFAYQWLRNGAEIGGATSSSYQLTATDIETVIQCRVTATNVGGGVVAVNANEGAKVVTRAVPRATASLPQPGFTFDGVFNGRVFYSDALTSVLAGEFISNLGDLNMYDLNTEKTTRITTTDDASIINVSEDGSHVYFISKSLIGGEGEAGKPNLGVWDATSESAKFIATVSEEDAGLAGAGGLNQTGSLNMWATAISSHTFGDRGRAMSHTRSTPDGRVLAFESTAQLTAFDNEEASASDCGREETGPPVPDQRCDEVYRYDTVSEDLTCVSCGPGTGPATGNARLQTISEHAGFGGVEPATVNAPVESLTRDGETVFFESTEALVPQDVNGTKDVYRWHNGAGVALISDGQDSGESALYGVTPDGSDVIFGTNQKLLPQDENGSTARLYDARVEGGFPPPEETVTEPCVDDACQGAASAPPEAPNVTSSSLNGGGNLPAKLRCARHSRRVVRKGSERCVRQKRPKHRRAHHKRRAAR